jgi:hypothetical protein
MVQFEKEASQPPSLLSLLRVEDNLVEFVLAFASTDCQ